MKNIPRQVLIGALALLFLTSACGAGRSPQAVETVMPDSPAPAMEGSTSSFIPITGENDVSMQCQFCVDQEVRAVLVFPDFAYFDVLSTSPVTCLTADVVNGRRILFCRGAQQASFTLNICSDSTNCLQFPVVLQDCLFNEPSIRPPIFLTPVNTQNQGASQPDNTGVQPPTQVNIPATPAATAMRPPSTNSPPTVEPRPTDRPATKEPKPTKQPKPTKKPSKTPKPDKDKK